MMKDLFHANEFRPCSPLSLAKCTNDAWLGVGYYFWESFIENAYSWGNSHYLNDGRSYQILKSEYDEHSDECLDLVDNVERIKEFNAACHDVETEAGEKAKYFYTRISLLRKYAPVYYAKYSCIRLLPMGGIADGRLLFSDRSKAFYAPYPPIQICFWEDDNKHPKLTFAQVDVVKPKIKFYSKYSSY